MFLQEYSVEIYEWSGTTWEPYVASDVQLQFYMMSPYVLKTMSTDRKVLSHFFFVFPESFPILNDRNVFFSFGVAGFVSCFF